MERMWPGRLKRKKSEINERSEEEFLARFWWNFKFAVLFKKNRNVYKIFFGNIVIWRIFSRLKNSSNRDATCSEFLAILWIDVLFEKFVKCEKVFWGFAKYLPIDIFGLEHSFECIFWICQVLSKFTTNPGWSVQNLKSCWIMRAQHVLIFN